MSTSETQTGAFSSKAPANSELDKLQLVETPPSAKRLAVAVAGYPYSVPAAVQDLLDNSIEAGATRVAVLLKETGALKDAIVIVDNGTGIAPEIIDEPLRAGSETQNRYSQDSLSRYGIGLKGAGFSLGQRITVLTKFNGGSIQRRSIDLQTIETLNKWVQETREPNTQEKNYFAWAMSQLPGQPDGSGTGTVVIIERLNLHSKDRDWNRLLKELIRACGEAYARFLSPSLPEANRLIMQVGSTAITPVDPLHRENPKTTVLYDRQEVKLSDGTSFFFSAAALPHPKQLDDELETKYRYSQEQQGIYAYRNNRLIASGHTFRLFKKDFHLNAFRAELVYNTNADHHVFVDVAKSTTILSPEAAGKLQEFVSNSTKTADVLWRERDVLTPEDIKGLFDESNRLIASRIKLLANKRVNPKTGKMKTRKGNHPSDAPLHLKGEAPYLVPVETLPDGVLYRPRLIAESDDVVVEVNLSHPFSKAVFAATPEEAKKRVPRKATTAVQQLLYILGATEFTFDSPEAVQLFESFRKHASTNLSGLLAGV